MSIVSQRYERKVTRLLQLYDDKMRLIDLFLSVQNREVTAK